ncbi:hypothetical protein [Myceligenerans salitolerans]|uniref:Uncharacterized protein n=1 Tax=Myceligenerans salitolerans TaxID=1230528 RepID=A0ABS3I4M0_9MICO|nr:hypothetical protein [Myceligenerans salitolerans]MBO0607561.1 hypothetical protein [Myceligenerans salitolerans]
MIFRRRPARREPEPDPTLDPFRGGVAILRRDGEFQGHVASEVTHFFARPRNRWWVWFVIAWADGTKDRLIEDYPPWSYVTEMRQGLFDYAGSMLMTDKARIGVYEVEWVPASEAARVRAEAGIRLEDF